MLELLGELVEAALGDDNALGLYLELYLAPALVRQVKVEQLIPRRVGLVRYGRLVLRLPARDTKTIRDVRYMISQ